MSKNLTVISRIDSTNVELSPSTRRQIRKQERKAALKGVNLRLTLPFYASGINRLFFYLPKVNDADLLTPDTSFLPAPPKVLQVMEDKTPVAAPAPAPVGKTKLTMEIAADIRNGKYGSGAAKIAKALGIGESTARDIIKGRTWTSAPVNA